MPNSPTLPKDGLPASSPQRMEAHTVRLPWPDKRLSPNARVHWRTKAAATRRARRTTSKLCIEAGLHCDFKQPLTIKTRVSLSLSFYAPDKRRRDDDNLIAAFKPYRDALAAHLKIDDSLFECRYALCGHAREHPKGAVVVTIGPVFERNGP